MNTNPNAKRILCFGDSYTWGYIPATDHQRFPANKRYPGILQIQLGNNYEIIEEGLNSRTLASDDTRPGKEGRNGLSYLVPCLDTHDPIDLVILMLGTNELKDSFDTTIEEIASLVENEYVKVILTRKSQFRQTTPKLILLSPLLLDLSKPYAIQRYSQSTPKSQRLAQLYQHIAQRNGCEFLDTHPITATGNDGVHIDEASHEKLGKELAKIVLLKLG